MQGIKEEFDANRKENYVSITDFITEQNKYEFSCGKCGKIFFADKPTFRRRVYLFCLFIRLSPTLAFI